MTEAAAGTLSVLQHADSMFPSGAVSFSWGLEALVNRGVVTGRETLSEFMAAHVRGRWAGLDRPAIAHAHAAGDDLDRLARLDRLVEAQSLGTEQRMGSTRMGNAFLSVHRRLGTPPAADYARMVAQGRAFGHVPVVQGMLWRGLGFSRPQALAMAAHGLCTGMLGAAIRLSIVSHLDAQAIHSGLLPLIEEALSAPLCDPDEMHAFIPQIEIASMNHETDEMRLFVN